jgi:hypothetical protein
MPSIATSDFPPQSRLVLFSGHCSCGDLIKQVSILSLPHVSIVLHTQVEVVVLSIADANEENESVDDGCRRS